MSCPKDFISYATVCRQNYPNNGRTPSLVHVGFDRCSISRSSDHAHWNPLLCNRANMLWIYRLEFSERQHIVSLSVPCLLYPGPRGFPYFIFSQHERAENRRTRVAKRRESEGDQRFFSLTASRLVLARLSRAEKKNQEKPLGPGKIYCSWVCEDVFEKYV